MFAICYRIFQATYCTQSLSSLMHMHTLYISNCILYYMYFCHCFQTQMRNICHAYTYDCMQEMAKRIAKQNNNTTTTTIRNELYWTALNWSTKKARWETKKKLRRSITIAPLLMHITINNQGAKYDCSPIYVSLSSTNHSYWCITHFFQHNIHTCAQHSTASISY